MASSQPPPHDLDAEGAVLSAILVDKRALDVAFTMLTAEDFYADRHGRIFQAARDLHGAGEPVDVIQVAKELRKAGRLEQVGGAPYLTEVIEASPATANVEAHARIVHEKARVRRLIATCQNIAAEGYLHEGAAQELLDAAEQRIHDVARSQVDSKLEPFHVVAQRLGKEVASVMAGKGRIMGASTGLVDLDAKLLGLRPGRLYVLAARPGCGKTALAMNVAHYVASQPRQHVAFFSLEMDNDELGTRALCAEARVDSMKIAQVGLAPEPFERFEAAVHRARDVRLHLCDDPNINVFAMRALARRLRSAAEQASGKLSLVVADYLQLMESPSRRKGENREQEVAGISRALKKLAKELRCPVLALSQLNRSVETRGTNQRPRLSDLRESGAIEQDADAVMFIHKLQVAKPVGPVRPMFGPRVEPHELIVAKCRGGAKGIIRLDFEKASTRFLPAERLDDDRLPSEPPDPMGPSGDDEAAQ